MIIILGGRKALSIYFKSNFTVIVFILRLPKNSVLVAGHIVMSFRTFFYKRYRRIGRNNENNEEGE